MKYEDLILDDAVLRRVYSLDDREPSADNYELLQALIDGKNIVVEYIAFDISIFRTLCIGCIAKKCLCAIIISNYMKYMLESIVQALHAENEIILLNAEDNIPENTQFIIYCDNGNKNVRRYDVQHCIVNKYELKERLQHDIEYFRFQCVVKSKPQELISYMCSDKDKLEVIEQIYDEIPISQSIIFCNTETTRNMIEEHFRRIKYSVSSNPNDAIMGNPRMIICLSDEIPCIDTESVSMVINYDPPMSTNIYKMHLSKCSSRLSSYILAYHKGNISCTPQCA